jgi:hypothetical protein
MPPPRSLAKSLLVTLPLLLLLLPLLLQGL